MFVIRYYLLRTLYKTGHNTLIDIVNCNPDPVIICRYLISLDFFDSVAPLPQNAYKLRTSHV